MRQPGYRCSAVAVAVAAICCLGYFAGHSVAAAGAVLATTPTDTEPAPPAEPQPSPDPAPIPEPKPAPAAKPAPKAVSTPAPVHVASTSPRSYTPSVSTTREPTPASTDATPARAHVAANARRAAVKSRHRHRRRAQARATVPAQPVVILTRLERPSPVARIATAAPSISGQSEGRNGLVIAGLVMAALLFLATAATPVQVSRFGSTGRVVLYHKTGLLLSGIGMLFVTAIVFLLAGT